jgi:ParB-like chromosome segregation protein Spo0J
MPSIANTGYEMVAVGRLKVHPRNPRQGDVGAICESIRANQFFGALVVQRSTCHVLAGNHRLLAAKQVGMAEVPVLWVDCDDDRALRILLADNRTNDLADYNPAALTDLLKELAATPAALTGTGYDGDALDELLAGLNPKSNDAAGDETYQPGSRFSVVVDFDNEHDQGSFLQEVEARGLSARLMIS